MQVGGPSWTVKLGRRDSTTASKSLANTDLPLFTDDLTTLISRFTNKGLTARDMVTLSGKFITSSILTYLYVYITDYY
jgi:peroxidase